MLEELIPLAANMIAYLVRLVIRAAEAEGIPREQALAKLHASEHLAETIDAREWAELAGSVKKES
jgi:hypothetical protein